MMFYEEYMRKNPLFGGEHKDEHILKPPPVDRLYAIYGTAMRRTARAHMSGHLHHRTQYTIHDTRTAAHALRRQLGDGDQLRVQARRGRLHRVGRLDLQGEADTA
mgnify:CR=1 FL=1